MKKYVKAFCCILLLPIFIVGCQKEVKGLSIDDITKEAQQIATNQGYSIKSDTYDEPMNGDSATYELIKDACVQGGYSLKELESNEEIKYVVFELEEKSKIDDGNIYLGLLIKNSKIVGAYLDYIGYDDSYKPINFTEYMK